MAMKKKKTNFSKTFGRMLSELAVYKWKITIVFLLCVVISCCWVACPLIIYYVMQKITQAFTLYHEGIDSWTQKLSEAAFLCLICFILYLLSFALGIVKTFVCTSVGQRYTYLLRKKIFNKTTTLSILTLDSKSTGDIVSRQTNDCWNISQVITTIFSEVVLNIFTIIASLIAMMIYNWQLGLILFISGPLCILFLSFLMKKSQKYYKENQDVIGKLNGRIEEVFSNHTIVSAFDTYKYEEKLFENDNKKAKKTGARTMFYTGIPQPFFSFIFNFAYLLVIVSASLLFTGSENVVAIISMFTLFSSLYNSSLGSIGGSIMNIQKSIAGAEKIYEFLDLEDMDKEENKKELFDTEKVKGSIEFNNVCFSYNKNKPIIKNFSIKIKPGQKIAIVGPTGAGKTTIVNLLMRFFELDSGYIKIDGKNIYETKRENLRSISSMVMQEPWIFDGSVLENIKYTANISDEQIKKISEMIGLDHFIQTLPKRYNTILSDKSTISNGEKQLISIARCIAQNNKIVILDEATSNVDSKTEIVVQKAMDKLCKGKTSIVIAHRLSTIVNSDLIIALKNGEIIETGTHKQLIKNKKGFYHKLYFSQFADF